MATLFVLNDPPYGTERAYNGLRLAHALGRRDEDVRVFLLGDAVGCAVAGQQTPEGYYNLGRMVQALTRRGGSVACCGTCLDARGVSEDRLLDGVLRSSLEQLAEWTLTSERVLVF
jgi:uncharacterized protein involved in oxidation of intracellular sulfur